MSHGYGNNSIPLRQLFAIILRLIPPRIFLVKIHDTLKFLISFNDYLVHILDSISLYMFAMMCKTLNVSEFNLAFKIWVKYQIMYLNN